MLETCPTNLIIPNNLIVAWSKINDDKYQNILCSISGGSDSDIMLDIVWRCDKNNKVTYVWFDTGIEYQKTKEHLLYLEEKYNITIHREKALKPVPLSCKQYGQPFISKQASEYIERLQKHNFDFANDGNKDFETLYEKYPKCKAALLWWCNLKGENSSFNISRNKWLKEFMIKNPPWFLISNKCCKYAKKELAHDYIKKHNCDLSIVGVRKAEGGTRSTAFKNCFSEKLKGSDEYRPLFWYKNQDKTDYNKAYNIKNSKCYTEYGLKRTGCAGCPFGRDFEYELTILKQYEPQLYKAATHIFADSYKYTRMYKQFCEERREKNEQRTIRTDVRKES